MAPSPTRLAGDPPKDRRFGQDVVVLVFVRFGAVAAGFLTSVLAARVLGATDLGAAGVALTVGSIAALIANGGLNIASTYYIGRRPLERQAITHRSITMGAAAAVLAAVLTLIAGSVLSARLFGVEDGPLVVATAVMAAGVVGYEIGGAIVLGLDRRMSYVVIQVLEGIGSFVATAIILLLVSATAAGMVLAAGIAYLASAVFAVVAAQRMVGGRILAFDLAYAREALALGLRGQIGNVLQFLNLRLDLILVPLFLDLHSAGIYLVAVRMSEVVTQIASSAAALLFPAVSRSDPTLTELTERTMRATLLVVVALGLVIALLAVPLLGIFFGQEFTAGSSALRITMIAMVPLTISRLLSGDMKGRGRAGLVSISAAAALGMTVVGDLVLIPAFGIEGAAVASCIAYSTGALTLLVAFQRVTGASLREFVPTPRDARALISMGLAFGVRLRPGR